MELTGNWKKGGHGRYGKQVQAQLGVLADAIDSIAVRRNVRQGEVLRDMWDWVLKSDIKVSMARLERDERGSERLTGVSISQEMYDTIENIRGEVPRGTFLRSITYAGLSASREDEVKEGCDERKRDE